MVLGRIVYGFLRLVYSHLQEGDVVSDLIKFVLELLLVSVCLGHERRLCQKEEVAYGHTVRLNSNLP